MAEPTNKTVAAAFCVKGRVQGVSFRWFTRQAAEDLGIGGWVRNCANGDVEGEAFGAAETLAQFFEHLRQGPPAARVEDLAWQAIVAASRPEFEPTAFEIRR